MTYFLAHLNRTAETAESIIPQDQLVDQLNKFLEVENNFDYLSYQFRDWEEKTKAEIQRDANLAEQITQLQSDLGELTPLKTELLTLKQRFVHLLLQGAERIDAIDLFDQIRPTAHIPYVQSPQSYFKLFKPTAQYYHLMQPQGVQDVEPSTILLLLWADRRPLTEVSRKEVNQDKFLSVTIDLVEKVIRLNTPAALTEFLLARLQEAL